MYFTVEIPTPTTKLDFDNLRWYMAHKDVEIYVDEDKSWNLLVNNPCQFLDKNKNKCTIYKDRPEACRQHSPDECEMYREGYAFERHFTDINELEKYIKKRFPKRKKKKK